MEETVLLLEKLRDGQTSAVNRQAFNMAIAAVKGCMKRERGEQDERRHDTGLRRTQEGADRG